MRFLRRVGARFLVAVVLVAVNACGSGTTAPTMPKAVPFGPAAAGSSRLTASHFRESHALAFLPQGAAGVNVVDEGGTTLATLPIPARTIALDDWANVYAVAPKATTITRHGALGVGNTDATYTPSAGNPVFYISASGAGALAAFGSLGTDANGVTTYITDVWDARHSGSPSRTLITHGTNEASFLAADGTLYVTDTDALGRQVYRLYAPGQETAFRIITESIVPADQQPNFAPNYAAVGSDGTLYVTEYSFLVGDALAGLYIYHPDGTENFVPTANDGKGAGPEGVGLDAAGNIYVANNNAGVDAATWKPRADSLHEVTVYSPGGAAALRHVVSSFDPIVLGVTSAGTTFVYSFNGFRVPTVRGTFLIEAGSSTVTQISNHVDAPLSISIYEGAFRRGRARNDHGGSHTTL